MVQLFTIVLREKKNNCQQSFFSPEAVHITLVVQNITTALFNSEETTLLRFNMNLKDKIVLRDTAVV